jgi:hypothetical protein
LFRDRSEKGDIQEQDIACRGDAILEHGIICVRRLALKFAYDNSISWYPRTPGDPGQTWNGHAFFLEHLYFSAFPGLALKRNLF